MKHLLFLSALCAAAAVSAAPGQQRRPASGPWAGCGTSLPGSVPCPSPLPTEFPAPILTPSTPPRPVPPIESTQAGKAELDRRWRFECDPTFCDPPAKLPGDDGQPGTATGGTSGGGGTGGVIAGGGLGSVEGGRNPTGEKSAERWMVFAYPDTCAIIVARTFAEAEIRAKRKRLPPPRNLLGFITQKGATGAFCVTTPGKGRRYFFVQGQRSDVPSKENATAQAKEKALQYMARNPRSQLDWVHFDYFR